MVDNLVDEKEKVTVAQKEVTSVSFESSESQQFFEIQKDRHQIFISYSRDDSAWMSEIRDQIDRLPDFSIDSWVDKNRLGPGDKIDQVIKEGLDKSTIAILLISPSFIKSNYIQEKEIPWILKRQNKTTGRLKVIFVPIFDTHKPESTEKNDQENTGKKEVEEYLETNQFNQSLSAISLSNALEATFERQGEGTRVGKVKEVVDGIRRIIDPTFSKLEQAFGDDYQILGKVAEGASAKIYRARKEGNQSDRAIKVLKHTRDLSWFQRSLKKASHINNIQNVISIFDHRVRSSMSYCVLKFIEGERLSQYIERTSPVSAEFTATVLTKIGTAVSQVRQEKVFQNVFFDIRPENIMIEFDTLEPYLSLAGRTENRLGIAHLEALRKDAKRATRETWGYVVPEFVCPQNQEPVLEITDQYLLGLMGYQMMNGKVPVPLNRDEFLSGEDAEFVTLNPCTKVRSFSNLMPIIARMVNIDPKKRFDSLSAAIAALNEPKKHSLSVVEESFRRCVRDELTSDVFFDDFYKRLMEKSDEVKNIFTDHGYAIDPETKRGRGVRWKRQRQMLCHAVLLCLKYFDDQCKDSQSEPNTLTFARNQHKNEKTSASAEAYKSFLNALVDTVKAHDSQWEDTYHHELWRAVIQPGLDYMQN